MAGRGSGKTRAGAEDISEFARTHPGTRVALVAPTFADVRDVMVEGDSGLLAVLPTTALRGGAVETAWNRSMGELYLANGVSLRAYSSEKPGRLRGPQHYRAWVDEVAELHDAARGDVVDTTWNNLLLGLRLGDDPRVVVTGTPKRRLLVRQLLADPDVVVTRGRTADNLANLSRRYRERVVDRYAGTRMARQELEGELLEDVEGALWRESWIIREEPPRPGTLARTVVAIDPADGQADGDEQAIVVAALGLDGRYYVLHSEGVRLSPHAWLTRAVALFDEFAADRLVWERNHGGAFLRDLLAVVRRDLPTREVHASDGKRTRAEPISALYEQGRAVHIGAHDVLEDQMTSYTGGPGEPSPDRLDALVWALSDLHQGGSQRAQVLDPGHASVGAITRGLLTEPF